MSQLIVELHPYPARQTKQREATRRHEPGRSLFASPDIGQVMRSDPMKPDHPFHFGFNFFTKRDMKISRPKGRYTTAPTITKKNTVYDMVS